MLAWCGYEATGFEVDNRRFLEAEMLRKVLAQIDERRTAHASPRNDFFLPLERPEHDNSLMIPTNVVVGNPEIPKVQTLWALKRYRYTIVDVDRFCHFRQSHERPDFAAWGGSRPN